MAKKKKPLQPELTENESAEPKLETAPESANPKIEDPIGDETDREAETSETGPETEIEDSSEAEPDSRPRPPAKLERLQKILAAAGVASRRSAEAMIEQGRVQVNGKVVTVLGTKADAGRDHIRVDGKLLQGAERLRYFVLNKPRGFVTTVKDPEGRPTVMQFFEKMKERLYPVGRLDYLSEGLLVVTNDGELANRLTKASSGVEKTYLVKVAGQPTEAELDILRGGVTIALGTPGSRQVRTSPARIRQVRQGDNPWYEVVIVEGRNRELRKMFEEIGHFVEKIRRTGYGPLVLDQEPGNMRELQLEEVAALRLASEGKLRTPKAKDLRRRNLLDAGLLPTVLPKPSGRPRQAPPISDSPSEPLASAARPSDFRPKKFGADRTGRTARPAESFASGEANKLFRSDRPSDERFRPAAGRTSDRGPTRTPARKFDQPRPATGTGPARFGSARPGPRSFDRPDSRPAGRPAWKKDDRPTRPPTRFAAGSTDESRPSTSRPFTAKPAWKKPDRTARPEFKRTAAPRRPMPEREARVFDEDLGPVRPPNLHIEEIPAERAGRTRPFQERPNNSHTGYSHPSESSSYAGRSGSDRSRPSRPSFDRPASSARPSSAKPFRSGPGVPTDRSSSAGWKGGMARPYSTSSGKPRAGGARPSSKPGSGQRAGADSRPSYGAKRPFQPRTEGSSDYRPTKAKPYPGSAPRAERKAGSGWKPKPSFGAGKPASGSHSGPRPGGFSKSGYKGKTGGAKRSGPRPGGKKRR
jgi:23S rRNA pseudouridine2605 synthase